MNCVYNLNFKRITFIYNKMEILSPKKKQNGDKKIEMMLYVRY